MREFGLGEWVVLGCMAAGACILVTLAAGAFMKAGGGADEAETGE